MKVEKYLGWVVVAAVLGACNGVTEPELPAERPFGSVSGYVVDEPINGATISVYAFDDGHQGELLATSSVTAADGAYSLQLQSKDRPVLIEARGGAFTDLVSGTHIDVDSDQVLRAVKMYRSGEPLSLMVTPLTHIAAGLAEYKATHGVSANDAVTQANAEISKLFQLDVTDTRPFSINDPAAADRDGQFYGFYLAAMSSWANWATQHGGATPNASFSTLELTQIIYNDIHADGKLDGIGFNPVTGQPMPLEFSGKPLDPEVYRIDLAQHMLFMANSNKNITGISAQQLLPRVQGLVAQTGGVVPEAPSPAGVTLYSLKVENAYYSGGFDFRVFSREPVVFSKVLFKLNGNDIGVANDLNQPAIYIDTTKYRNGDYAVTVIATDMLNNNYEKTFTFKFDNGVPRANVTPKLTNQRPFVLTGDYTEGVAALDKVLVNGQLGSFKSTNKTWSALVSLNEGVNTFNVVLIDVLGNQSEATTTVTLDQTAPSFDTTAGHSAASFWNNGSVTNKNLADTNDANNIDAVLFDTTRVDLNGAAVDRVVLTAALIPFFAFTPDDPIVANVHSTADKVSAALRVGKNCQVTNNTQLTGCQTLTSSWVQLIRRNNSAEYVLPLATETLYPDWLKSTPADVIYLWVKLIDEAGNQGYKIFTFKPAFVVPAFGDGDVMTTDIGAGAFAPGFDSRVNLQNMPFDDAEYTFKNTTGRPYYIKVTDTGQHAANRWIEQRIREHKVIITTTTEWHADFVDPSSALCPQPGAAQQIPFVYNYTGVDWQRKQPLAPVDTSYFETHDALPSQGSSNWESLVFDNNFYPLNGNQVDYSPTDPAGGDPATVAMVGGCAASSLEWREVSSYASALGYPTNRLTPSSLTQTKSFDAGTFKVFKNIKPSDPGYEIGAVNDRYLVPAGAQVTVRRKLVTPGLNIDNDTDVLSASKPISYQQAISYDQKIEWNVQNKLLIEVVHDTGNTTNNDVMPVRKNDLVAASKTYKVDRAPQSQ